MKKLMLILVVLSAMWQVCFADLPDTVWTKNIWPEEVKTVLFSQDGSNVYVSTNKGKVHIYNTLTGDSVGILIGVGDFRFYSPDKKFIYTSALRKLDAQTFEVLAKYDTIPTKYFSVGDVALTGDGNYLVVTSNVMHNDSTGIAFYDNIAVFNTENMKIFKLFSHPKNYIASDLAASSDRKYFALFTTGCQQYLPDFKNCINQIEIWDAQTFQYIKTIYQDTLPVNILKFTPDSKYLAIAPNQPPWNVLFYETENFKLSKKTGGTEAIAFTIDSKFMVTGAFPKIWDLNTNQLFYDYGNKNPFGQNAIDISNDDKFIMTGTSYLLALLNAKFNDTRIHENSKNYENLSIYPNPINGLASITITNTLPGIYQVKIINNSGIQIQELFNNFLEPGNHEFKWNTTPYPSGIYFCKITGNNVNLTYKIIVNK